MLFGADVWREFSANPPADTQAIENLEAQVGIRLPRDYVGFLQRMNGGEGFLGEEYLSMWSIDWIIKSHETNMADDFWPGFLGFGSNGNLERFGFNLRNDAKEIVALPYIGNWEDALYIAPTFTAFLEAMYKVSLEPFFKEG